MNLYYYNGFYYAFEIVGALLLVVSFFILLSIVAYSITNGISPMPSTSRAISAMISMALPEVKEDMVIFDLGSGWGGLAVALAKHFPNHRVYGIENSLFPFLYSRLRNLLFPRSNLYYLRGDILEIKFDSPCIIVCYLYSGAMKKLKEKFEQDLQEGSVILSNTFTLVDKVPEDILELNDLYKTKIYKYRFKRQSTIQTHDCNLM